MEQVRIGIIGFGGMGSGHGRYLADGKVAGARLAAACDINPAREQAARQIGGEDLLFFTDADALFAAGVVDAVMIATPHYAHPPLAIRAFANGCHVLSEKPAGVYAKQVREMNEAAAASGKVFGVMFNQRTLNVFQKMRDLVQSGELGEMRRVVYQITNWFRPQAYYDSGGWRATWGGEGGGVLANQCPHNLDLWQWICGMPARLRAFCYFGKYHNIEVEDDVTAYVEYPNGATGVFITTTGEAPGTNRFEITGERGKLLFENDTLTFWRTRVSVSEFLQVSQEHFTRPECWKCEIPTGGGGGHAEITQNWVNAIRTGAPLLAAGQEGIRGVQLANAMHLSAWTDDWVNVPADEELYYEKLKEKIETSTFKKAEVVEKAMDFAGSFNAGS
ncbi:MAG: Gfo/Idh/MocA family protein [Armatimonadota bacterium]